MIERKKTYKIETKLASGYSLNYILESMCEFWFCKPEEIEIQAIHDNLFRIVKNGKILKPVIWWKDKRFGNSVIRMWNFCVLVDCVE